MCNKPRLIFTTAICFAHGWYSAHANFQALSEAAFRAVKFNYFEKIYHSAHFEQAQQMPVIHII